uniref:DUF4296 domain-containing protein n=1 Tax=Flavobacterium sp. TaxID=239 RepID=UPI00404A9B03
MRIFIFLVGLLLFSCTKKPVQKPENLLSEEVMVDILYDTLLLQAAEAQAYDKLTENKIRVNTFIYNKYKIDSATYYQNHKYYAANLSKFKKMYNEVTSRLENTKIKLDSLNSNNTMDFNKGKSTKKSIHLLD